MNPAIRVLQVVLVLSIFISVSLGQEVNIKKENNTVEKSGAIKNINSPQAGGDKIIFRDGTTPLLDIENLDEAGALILYDATVTGGGTGKYLQNNGGNLLWGGQQLGLASGGVSAIGDLSDAKTGGSSLYLGDEAGLSANTTSFLYNTGVGARALKSNSGGGYNTAIGVEALENYNQSNPNGNNTSIGLQSLRYNIIGSNNTALGAYSLRDNLGSGNVAIGFQAGQSETGSNKLYIENSNSSTPLIYGEFDNDLVKINGQLLVTNRSGFGALESIASLNVRGISGDLIAFRVEEPGGSPKFQVSNSGHVGINQFFNNVTTNIRGISGDITYFTVEDPTGGIFFDVFPSGNATFYNDLTVNGNLSKGGGSFKIDHPLDPTNKNLYHSFVESPDMMNVYNGNVTLDGNGEATVIMADWFEALNKDYRYQLTAIGAPGPNLYVAEKFSGNQFRIAGGTPGMEVSWQVTGVRQDAYANENRIKVEELKKPEERGKYLHPTAFGQPKEMGISHSEELKRQEINTQN